MLKLLDPSSLFLDSYSEWTSMRNETGLIIVNGVMASIQPLSIQPRRRADVLMDGHNGREVNR